MLGCKYKSRTGLCQTEGLRKVPPAFLPPHCPSFAGILPIGGSSLGQAAGYGPPPSNQHTGLDCENFCRPLKLMMLRTPGFDIGGKGQTLPAGMVNGEYVLDGRCFFLDNILFQ